MTKQATPTTKRVTKGTITKALQSPVDALQALAAAVTQAAPVQAPVKAKTATLAGLPEKIKIKEGAKYRTKAPHCVARWDAIVKAVKDGEGAADTAKMLEACKPGSEAHDYAGPGVPSHFLRYAIRRGYLVAA